MASLKAEKPLGSQTLLGQPKKEAAKPTDGASKTPAPAPAMTAKPALKKAEQKPREPKKKAKGGKPAAKN